MSGFEFDILNIINGRGLEISIMGMSIVFSALLFISMITAFMPKILPLIEKVFPENQGGHQTHGLKTKKTSTDEEIAAIAYAIHQQS